MASDAAKPPNRDLPILRVAFAVNAASDCIDWGWCLRKKQRKG